MIDILNILLSATPFELGFVEFVRPEPFVLVGRWDSGVLMVGQWDTGFVLTTDMEGERA